MSPANMSDGHMPALDTAQLNALLAEYLIPNTTILALYLVIGLVGNIIVVLVYNFRIKANKDDRFFIPYLALGDLMSCIMGTTFALSLNLLPIKFEGDVTCKVLWFFTSWTTLIAALMLVVIAIHRYLKVCRPFGAQMTLRRKYVALLTIVIVASVASIPATFFYGEIEVVNRQTNVTGFRCGRYASPELSDFLSAFNIVLFVTAVVGISTITLLYIQVGRSIYRQTKFRQRIRSSAVTATLPNPKPEADSGVVSDSNQRPNDVFDDDSKTENEAPQTKSRTDKGSRDNRKDSKDSLFSEDEHEEAMKSTKKDAKTYDNGENLRRDSSDDELEINVRPRKRSVFTAAKKLDFRACVRRYKYSFLFMVISLVFIISFTPRMVIMILEAMDENFWDNLPDEYIRTCLFFYRFYIINNIINPFLYAAFDVRFRQEIRKVCKRQS